jgi:RNA polymerase sigma-70 factor (ECF subfamily)
MQPSPQTRTSLVVRLHDAQNHQAWEEFLAVYQPLILRLMRHNGLSEEDARDVCQQVLQGVASDVQRWKPDGREASFRRWLFRIARNRMIKFLVQQRKQTAGRGGTSIQRILAAYPARDISSQFQNEYRQQLLWWAADQIRPEFRDATWQAFWRTCVDGQPVTDVARELGTTAGNVYVARSRIVARLRARIQEINDDP